MKKIFLIVLALSLFAAVWFFIDFSKARQGCAFCDPKVLERQTFFHGEKALAVLTYKPAVPGHVLIIPKRHVERFEELTSEEVMAIGEMIQKVDRAVQKKFGSRDYVLIQKNGKKAGQSVPHVHFHYVPSSRFLALKYLLSPLFKPLSEQELKHLKETFSGSF